MLVYLELEEREKNKRYLERLENHFSPLYKFILAPEGYTVDGFICRGQPTRDTRSFDCVGLLKFVHAAFQNSSAGYLSIPSQTFKTLLDWQIWGGKPQREREDTLRPLDALFVFPIGDSLFLYKYDSTHRIDPSSPQIPVDLLKKITI